MIEPRPSEKETARAFLRKRYLMKREEYLGLCDRYELSPREVSLSKIESLAMNCEDRRRLFRLIVLLMNLEKLLPPHEEGEPLFSENEWNYSNSCLFQAVYH